MTKSQGASKDQLGSVSSTFICDVPDVCVYFLMISEVNKHSYMLVIFFYSLETNL